MSCYRPLQAYRAPGGEVVMGSDWRGDGRSLELPCGKCIGCRLERARAWSVRITHEAQLYDSNLFVTLTYSEDKIPRSLSLEYSDFQAFMKRLRRRVVGVTPCPDGRKAIRFFVAGEYGGKTGRPHYHAILFNIRFSDQVPFRNGTFGSDLCEELWNRGNVVIGSVTNRSAAYVAGYTLKKVYGQGAGEYYEDVVNLRTGELSSRRPEFVVMSRRPGIGAWWYSRFGSDVLPVDHAVQDGTCYKVPRFYLERWKLEAEATQVEEVMHGRFLRAMEQRSESTPERRAVREELAWRRQAMYSERGL